MLAACSTGTAGSAAADAAPLAAQAATSGSAAGLPAAGAVAQQASSGQPRRNRCDAQAAQRLIGERVDAGTLARAIAAAGADEARLLAENAIVTKEFKLGRLNVVVGADQRIIHIHCG